MGCSFNKQSVDIYVTDRKERVVPKFAREPQGCISARRSSLIFNNQGIIGLFHFLNEPFALGGSWKQGHFWCACCEPLSLLHLHPVPRGIANYSIKAAFWLLTFP